MFMGEFEHSLDAKNRVIIPADFRDELEDKIVITKGKNGCLEGYSKAVFDEYIESVIGGRSRLEEDVIIFKRRTLANGRNCEFDKQGRIVIPQSHKEYAGLDKDVVIVGMGDYFEIWDRTSWAKQSEYCDSQYEEVTHRLSGGAN